MRLGGPKSFQAKEEWTGERLWLTGRVCAVTGGTGLEALQGCGCPLGRSAEMSTRGCGGGVGGPAGQGL